MIILDTNVISALMQRQPSQKVIAWLDQQDAEVVHTTSITVFELEYGVRVLVQGRRRELLEAAIEKTIAVTFAGRILAFDIHAARHAAEVCFERRAAGRPVEVRDVQIAGIARAYGARVATRNIRHFEQNVEIVNPWEA